MQNWQQYESQYQIEALLYNLCIQSWLRNLKAL